MSFYSDLYNSGNIAGYHTFDGIVLNLIPGNWVQTKVRDTADGEVITLTRGQTVVTALLHKNGRTGPRDLSVDTLVVALTELLQFTDAICAQIYPYEQVPGGRHS